MVGVVYVYRPGGVVLNEIWRRNERLWHAYEELCSLIGIEPKQFECADWYTLRQELSVEFRTLYSHCLAYNVDVSSIAKWWER